MLKYKFGIVIAEYNTILEAQNGVCAICKQPETAKDMRRGKVKSLAVDHNHKTGKIRGLLCDRCNTSIGKFNDDPNLIEKAVEYLRIKDEE